MRQKLPVRAPLSGSTEISHQRAQDYNYQSIYRVADRNGLGKEAAGKVYEIKKVAEDQNFGVALSCFIKVPGQQLAIT